MQTTSLFDKGKIDVQALGTVAAGATHADALVNISGYQRVLLMIVSAGPNPVGTVTLNLKSKKGGAAAVALETERLMYTGYAANNGGPLTTKAVALLGAAGAIVIPTTLTVGVSTNGIFTYGILLDVPVLPDGTDQIAVGVTNNGTAGVALTLVTVLEHPRY